MPVRTTTWRSPFAAGTCASEFRRCSAKSSIHNDACAVGPRWAARCGVLGRARMPAYERVLRPCLAVAHRTPTTKAIMNRALGAAIAVAEAAHGLDRHRLGRVRIELAAQVADVELDLVGRDAVRVAPHELEQLAAAEDLVWMPNEGRQELELERCQ